MLKTLCLIILISIPLFPATYLPQEVEASPIVYDEPNPSALSTLEIKDFIFSHFRDTPLMIYVVNCESGFRQFNKSGSPLISRTNDVGVMQINEVHWDRAEQLGLDIFYSEIDNIKMGKLILEESGLRAWSCFQLLKKSLDKK